MYTLHANDLNCQKQHWVVEAVLVELQLVRFTLFSNKEPASKKPCVFRSPHSESGLRVLFNEMSNIFAQIVRWFLVIWQNLVPVQRRVLYVNIKTEQTF